MSLSTGSILKVIKDYLDIVKTSFRSKYLIANGLQIIEN